MNGFIGFVKTWAGAIGDLFSKYPLAAALVTIAAIAAFLILQKKKYAIDWSSTTLNFFIVLVGWLIAVPIIGFFIDVVIKISSATTGVVGFIGRSLRFLYVKYEQQPICVLIILILSIASYILWPRILPKKDPGRSIRIIVVVLAFVILTAISVPIVNLFSSSIESEKPEHHKKNVQSISEKKSNIWLHRTADNSGHLLRQFSAT